MAPRSRRSALWATILRPQSPSYVSFLLTVLQRVSFTSHNLWSILSKLSNLFTTRVWSCVVPIRIHGQLTIGIHLVFIPHFTIEADILDVLDDY
jgi:hypothetical protein